MDYIGLFHMKDYSHYYIEFCKMCIDTFEQEKEMHIVRNNLTYSFTELNISHINDVGSKQMIAAFYGEMKKILIDYQKRFFLHENQIPQSFDFEEIRIKKYRKGSNEQFRMHTDVGNAKSSKRFLAFQLYLNDVHQGGETCFPDFRKTIVPEQGKVLVFPPLWTHLHCGNPPISHDKYILTSYLHYK